MTKNQLTVPETSDERDELVQQVLDNPRELAPSVQVRFAKRVGRPGNSRVMMMDAQTSGPIGEDGEDTESKLALRLADGTNVQLSLSFFNENQPALAGVGNGGGGRRANFAPFNTYSYEPRTYSIHERDSSRLPAIMMSMAFMLGAACYGVLCLTGQVHDQFALIPKSQLIQVGKPVTATSVAKQMTAKTATVKTAPALARTASKVANETGPVTPVVSEVTPTKSNTRKIPAKSRTHEGTQITHSSHSPRGEFFVPPPPPMSFDSPPTMKGFVPPPPPTPYTMPTAIPTAIDPLQALAPAVAHSNRAYTAPKKVVPVSMTSTIETKLPVQQIAPSTIEKPVVQQYGDLNQLQEQQPISAPIR